MVGPESKDAVIQFLDQIKVRFSLTKVVLVMGKVSQIGHSPLMIGFHH